MRRASHFLLGRWGPIALGACCAILAALFADWNAYAGGRLLDVATIPERAFFSAILGVVVALVYAAIAAVVRRYFLPAGYVPRWCVGCGSDRLGLPKDAPCPHCVCPSCGYDRRGLAVDSACPECGAIGAPSVAGRLGK
jgi:hypothetical protein